VVLLRAAWLIPRQLRELGDYGYGAPTESLPTEGSARVDGRVVGAWTGEPRVGVEVVLTRVRAAEPPPGDGATWVSAAAPAVVTDEEGRFSTQVAPGLYRIQTRAAGYWSVGLDQVFVTSSGHVPEDLLVVDHPLCQVEVTITEGGRPVDGAELFLRAGDPGRAFFTRRPRGLVATDARGVARWEGMCGAGTLRYVKLPGEVERFVEMPLWLEPGRDPLALRAEDVREAPLHRGSPSTVIDPKADEGRLEVVPRLYRPVDAGTWRDGTAEIVDPGGHPVDALLLLDPVGPNAYWDTLSSRFYPDAGHTAETGQVVVRSLAPGRYRPVVRPVDGALQVLPEIEVAAGAPADLGRLVVEAVEPAALEGRVVGPHGPVAGAEVYLLGTEELGRMFLTFTRAHRGGRTVTGVDGHYRLGHLPPGDLVLVAYHGDVGASAPAAIDAGAGESAALDLALVPYTVDRRSGWIHGLMVELDRDGPFVFGVTLDSPAARAGVLPGDRVLAIGDEPASWAERTEVYARLVTPAGELPPPLTLREPGADEARVVQLEPAAPTPFD